MTEPKSIQELRAAVTEPTQEEIDRALTAADDLTMRKGVRYLAPSWRDHICILATALRAAQAKLKQVEAETWEKAAEWCDTHLSEYCEDAGIEFRRRAEAARAESGEVADG